MPLNIPMRRMEMPKGGKPPVRLMGFDFGEHLFHLLAFDFGDDGGAVGIWREGDNFCARISLDALAEFWQAAKVGKADEPAAGQALHAAALAVVGDLARHDPAPDKPMGLALTKLSEAVEAYERATLPPPFGSAGVTACIPGSQLPDFAAHWKERYEWNGQRGYRYGRDALEQVRFGYEIARAALIESSRTPGVNGPLEGRDG